MGIKIVYLSFDKLSIILTKEKRDNMILIDHKLCHKKIIMCNTLSQIFIMQVNVFMYDKSGINGLILVNYLGHI